LVAIYQTTWSHNWEDSNPQKMLLDVAVWHCIYDREKYLSLLEEDVKYSQVLYFTIHVMSTVECVPTKVTQYTDTRQVASQVL
jgi:hypothetical protein